MADRPTYSRRLVYRVQSSDKAGGGGRARRGGGGGGGGAGEAAAAAVGPEEEGEPGKKRTIGSSSSSIPCSEREQIQFRPASKIHKELQRSKKPRHFFSTLSSSERLRVIHEFSTKETVEVGSDSQQPFASTTMGSQSRKCYVYRPSTNTRSGCRLSEQTEINQQLSNERLVRSTVAQTVRCERPGSVTVTGNESGDIDKTSTVRRGTDENVSLERT